MLNCLFCDTTLTNRQDAIKHLEIAHNMVRGVVNQEGNPGDFTSQRAAITGSQAISAAGAARARYV